MKITRHRLMDYLGTKQIATSTELSRSLQVTAADVRHHLTLLVEEGLIQVVGERKPRGPGRPARLYSLSPKKKRDNLLLLLEAFLQDVDTTKPKKDKINILQRIAEKIRGPTQSQGNLTQQLFSSINHLNDINYQARWEAHPDAPRIIFGNCPYSAIISNHPELCQIDKFILEGLLNVNVEQEDKLARDERGILYCLFRINDKG